MIDFVQTTNLLHQFALQEIVVFVNEVLKAPSF